MVDPIATARRIRDDLDALITELESDGVRRNRIPAKFRRRYELLREVEEAGGSVTAEEWHSLGESHDFDVRGLGGFFVGEGRSMEKIRDERRLTNVGRAWLRWYEGRYHAAGRRRARRRAAGR